MNNYFVDIYVDLGAGYVGIFTNYLMAIGIVLLLGDFSVKPRRKLVLSLIVQMLCCIVAFELFSAFYFFILFKYFVYYTVLACASTVVLYTAFISKNSLQVRLMRASSYFGFTCIISVFSMALGVSVGVQARYLQWLIILFYFVVLLVGTLLIRFRSISDEIIGNNRLVAIIVAVGLLGLLPYIAFFSLMAPSDVIFLFCILMFVLIFIVYVLITASIKNTYKSEYMRARELMREASDDVLRLNEENLEALRSLRHEFRNKMFYMQTLLDSKQYDKLAEYLKEISEQTEATHGVIDCGNNIVNAIVAALWGRAVGCGATLDCAITVPPKLGVEDVDLCSLMMNLIGNAIEYIERTPELDDKIIRLEITTVNKTLVIAVKNAIRDVDCRRALSLATSKAKKELHGYGSKIVASIANKYYGAVSYSADGGIFVATVSLTDTAEENDK